MRWKQLYDLHSQKEEGLRKELELEKEKLEAQMEYAKYEHETEVLRDQLRARELDKERQKREWEMKERQVEEERLRTEEQMRRTQEEMESRILQQQEELRRRQQENSLFMQAHNLDSMLEQQEQAYDQPAGYGHRKFFFLIVILNLYLLLDITCFKWLFSSCTEKNNLQYNL